MKDAKKLTDNLTDYVEAVVKAIAEYGNYPYQEPNSKPEEDYYIVKKGDTLYKIASLYNTTPENLKQLNNLTNDVLTIGQKLLIKELTNKYVVKKGDTLYGIARELKTTVTELKQLNNLTNDTLTVGQELIIPNNNTIEELNTQEYIVKKGDSLWKIAKDFNIPVEELINLNSLNNLTIQVDQKLLVPAQNIEIDTSPNKSYIVQTGDTLWSIAKKNNITVDELKQLNNLSSNLLTIGQILIIEE